MQKHYVTFLSPGIFVAEDTTKEVPSWDIEAAKAMASSINERYGAKPYAFYFTTRSREEEDFEPKCTETSPTYYLPHCKVETIDDVRKRADPNERILLRNMEINDWSRIVTTTEGWKWTQPLHDSDIVLT